MAEAAPPYSRFAEIYDEAGHGEYTDWVRKWLMNVLGKRGFRERKVLEIACGTGNLALALAREGWKVWGIDVSPPMLHKARRKAEREKLHVEFSQMDMREIHMHEKVDLVVSCYDGLNYMLSEEDLWKVFDGVSRVLRRGGFFVFDMNTKEAYERCWASGIPYVVQKSWFTLILEARYNRKLQLGEMEVTGFIRKGSLFERFREIHAERPFLKTRVRRLLYRAGFQVEHTEIFNPFPACGSRKEPFKALWLCKLSGRFHPEGEEGPGKNRSGRPREKIMGRSSGIPSPSTVRFSGQKGWRRIRNRKKGGEEA